MQYKCVPLLPLRHIPAGKGPSQQALIQKERVKKLHVALSWRRDALVHYCPPTLACALSLSLFLSPSRRFFSLFLSLSLSPSLFLSRPVFLSNFSRIHTSLSRLSSLFASFLLARFSPIFTQPSLVIFSRPFLRLVHRIPKHLAMRHRFSFPFSLPSCPRALDLPLPLSFFSSLSLSTCTRISPSPSILARSSFSLSLVVVPSVSVARSSRFSLFLALSPSPYIDIRRFLSVTLFSVSLGTEFGSFGGFPHCISTDIGVAYRASSNQRAGRTRATTSREHLILAALSPYNYPI